MEKKIEYNGRNYLVDTLRPSVQLLVRRPNPVLAFGFKNSSKMTVEVPQEISVELEHEIAHHLGRNFSTSKAWSTFFED